MPEALRAAQNRAGLVDEGVVGGDAALVHGVEAGVLSLDSRGLRAVRK